MKKILFILPGLVLASLVACGPSSEEKKAQEEALQKAADSTASILIEKASVAAADSVMAVPADSARR